MKAVVNTRYGSPDVLAFREVPIPEPGDNELLIKVQATTVSRTDSGTLRAQPPLLGRLMTGLWRPRHTILGIDFAGIVETTGKQVTHFKPGDRVFGLSDKHYGAHAEYLCLPETGALAMMPSGLGFNDAVLCEGAWYADTYLRRFDVGPGHELLIYGGSGAIGTAAIQLAKAYGARVTTVVSTRHLALADSLGADVVIDHTAQDFTRLDQRFDFVLDAVGKTTYFKCRSLLKPGGVYSATDLGPWWQNLFLALWFSATGSGRVVMPMPECSQSLIEHFRQLMQQGQLRAVIDNVYALDDIVPAYIYVESGRKTGIVVVSNTPASTSAARLS
ncbi:MAG: NAD(P)-dependent alcohol dehydrogenase [Burkholderiaceae bacterium]